MRRWAMRLLALGAGGALVWALAPALSAARWSPAPRDFEQPLRGVERLAGVAASGRGGHRTGPAGEGPVTHRSAVLRAPGRFDAAGIAGELRPVELRARERGGQWSGWLEIANGDPAWFGGAEELQVRTRGWRPTGRIHYVNVSGDASEGEALLTDVRQTVNGAMVAAAGLLGDEAAAQPPRPDIVTRRRWGAGDGGCEPRSNPQRGEVRAAVVHHTVGSNDYSRAEAPNVVLAICRYHRNSLGWNDIGYNALVDRFGTVYAGRAGGLRRPIVGAHAEGVNSLTTGVAAMGTHTSVQPSKGARRGLTDLLAWKLVQHGISAKGRPWMTSGGGSSSRYGAGESFRMRRIVGHWRTNITECPGDSLNRKLRKHLRNRIQNRIERYEAKGSGGIGRS